LVASSAFSVMPTGSIFSLSSRALERDEAGPVEFECLVEHGFDVRPGVDRDRGQRQVF